MTQYVLIREIKKPNGSKLRSIVNDREHDAKSVPAVPFLYETLCAAVSATEDSLYYLPPHERKIVTTEMLAGNTVRYSAAAIEEYAQVEFGAATRQKDIPRIQQETQRREAELKAAYEREAESKRREPKP